MYKLMTKTLVKVDFENKDMALAIVQALKLWSDPSYKGFLHEGNNRLDEKWFQWFIGQWNVGRTIQAGEQGKVRSYLDKEFRKSLRKGAVGVMVDRAALFIREEGWSSKTGRNKKPGLPTSLVSKIGFFLCPSVLVPFDRYSLVGLNQFQRGFGSPRLNNPTYAEYLSSFDQLYKKEVWQINGSLKSAWVSELAGVLNCSQKSLRSIAFKRKVLDNYLMHSGGYLKR